MRKAKALTRRQRQRTQLDKVLDFNEEKLVAMQAKDWKDLYCEEIGLLERFLATALGTMRKCPPSYVIEAAANITIINAEGKVEINPGLVKEDVKP